MNQKGVVSLVSVGLISILVLIITTATSALMVGEFRQSIDNENGIKAYYGAYSGLEESFAYVSQQLSTGATLASLQQDCATGPVSIQPFLPDVSGAPADVGHTCRVIETQNVEPKGTIDADKVVQYNLTYVKPAVSSRYIKDIELTWEEKIGAPSTPPLLATIVTFPKNAATATPTDIRTVILQPGGPLPTSSADFNTRTSITGNIVTPTICTVATPSSCTMRLTDVLNGNASSGTLSSLNTILRLRAYNGDVRYTLKVYDDTGAQVNVVLPEIHADMTSRSGDAFQRLSSNIPIQSKPLSIVDNIIFGNNSVCKDFIILSDTSGVGGSGSYEKIQVGPSPGGCTIDNSNLF